jgi:hypothetical protein
MIYNTSAVGAVPPERRRITSSPDFKTRNAVLE